MDSGCYAVIDHGSRRFRGYWPTLTRSPVSTPFTAYRLTHSFLPHSHACVPRSFVFDLAPQIPHHSSYCLALSSNSHRKPLATHLSLFSTLWRTSFNVRSLIKRPRTSLAATLVVLCSMLSSSKHIGLYSLSLSLFYTIIIQADQADHNHHSNPKKHRRRSSAAMSSPLPPMRSTRSAPCGSSRT
ncbi:hypothetical protein BC827DRAFT_359797 [Russula dissimulans]|nr:hypothetical protein BC827DRAFT_359797 [Russula dissimulans]